MPNISTFMLCDSIQNIPTVDGGFVPGLFSPQLALRPRVIPGAFTFGVAVGIVGVDLTKENILRAEILNPEGKTVFAQADEMLKVVSKDDVHLPKDNQGFILCTEIRNLGIETEGNYKFVVYINNEKIGEKEIPIFKGMA